MESDPNDLPIDLQTGTTRRAAAQAPAVQLMSNSHRICSRSWDTTEAQSCPSTSAKSSDTASLTRIGSNACIISVFPAQAYPPDPKSCASTPTRTEKSKSSSPSPGSGPRTAWTVTSKQRGDSCSRAARWRASVPAAAPSRSYAQVRVGHGTPIVGIDAHEVRLVLAPCWFHVWRSIDLGPI